MQGEWFILLPVPTEWEAAGSVCFTAWLNIVSVKDFLDSAWMDKAVSFTRYYGA